MKKTARCKRNISFTVAAALTAAVVMPSSLAAKTIQINNFYLEFNSFYSNKGGIINVNTYSFSPVSLNDIGNSIYNNNPYAVPPFDGTNPDNNGYPAIGIATNDQAVDGTEYDWQNDNSQNYSYIYANDLNTQDNNGANSAQWNASVYVGRSDSQHVANMFSYMHSNALGSSGTCFSNASNLSQLDDSCSDPMFADGLPTQLNFFFLVDLDTTLDITDANGNVTQQDVSCNNLVFAQQGDEPFGPSFFHAFASVLNAGVDVAEGIGKLVATEGDEGYKTFGEGMVKTAKATKEVSQWGAAQHNPWWLSQLFTDQNNNFSQYIPSGNQGPSTSLSQSQSRAILSCTNNYLLVVTYDDSSYDTFNAEFVPYTIEQ